MFQIIEVFLGFSIGIAVLWVTILALVKFTRRVMSGEEWKDVLRDLWKKPLRRRLYPPKPEPRFRRILEATDRLGEKIFEHKLMRNRLITLWDYCVSLAAR